MNTFRKIDGQWCVSVLSPTVQPGDTVTVTLASGATKEVKLGAQVGTYFDKRIFATAPRPSTPKVEIGSLDGILAVFNNAARHLQYPAIVLLLNSGPGSIRVSRAGARAKFPGSLNVTSAEKDDSEYGRTWFGRITLDGKYSPSRDATPEMAAALQAFAADPVKVATEYGRLTGNCCFCRKALTDERSTAVGYGQTCADHYGLPWGAKAPLTCDAA